MKKITLIGLATALTFGLAAQESTGTSSESTATLKKSTKTKADIDDEITNARMRAANGSKSKVSASLGLGYTGASLKNPFDGIRPNLAGTSQSQSTSRATGDLSARYRIDKNQSVSAGFGVQILQPFQDNSKLKTQRSSLKKANEFNVRNPYAAYTTSYKLGDYQSSSSIDYTQITDKVTKSYGYVGAASINQTMMKQYGTSGISAGFAVSFIEYFLNSTASDGESQREIGLYPMAEYQINDTFVFRTVFGYFNFNNTKADNALSFRRTYEYQSVGIGIVASRNIWIYPNIQFVPDELDAGFTNIAVSATINLF